MAAPYARHPHAREAHLQLATAGLVPSSRWATRAALGPDDALTAFDIDREDIAGSDAMLALLDAPGGKETYCEIEVARSMGVPIAWVDGLPDEARDGHGVVPREERERLIAAKEGYWGGRRLGHHEPMSLHQYARTTGLARGHETAAAAIAWLSTMPRGDRAWTRVALMRVDAERLRQDRKWGRAPGVWTNDAGIKLAVLVEEVGEVARAVLERSDLGHLREELIQVAAVAVAWAECVDAGTERHRKIVTDDQEARTAQRFCVGCNRVLGERTEHNAGGRCYECRDPGP